MPRPLRLATCSLAGCFGCHMSFLDLDERLLELVRMVEFDRSPFTDIKALSAEGVDVGLIEGGVCNVENVHVLRAFRARCATLVAVGACALNGGVPALRNRFSATECLRNAYESGIGLDPNHAGPPNDPELPPLLDKVYPVHEVVRIDYALPGCPPPADAFWELLSALAEGREPQLPGEWRRFD